MPEESNPHPGDVLARHQLDLDRLKDALALLGVNACSHCKKFLRRSDPGALFDAGELVCYGCIHEWWPQRAAPTRHQRARNPRGQAGLLAARLPSRRDVQGSREASGGFAAGTAHRRQLPGMPRSGKILGPGALPLLRRPGHSVGYRLAKKAVAVRGRQFLSSTRSEPAEKSQVVWRQDQPDRRDGHVTEGKSQEIGSERLENGKIKLSDEICQNNKSSEVMLGPFLSASSSL